ncbi:cell wall-binding repeat-containing protein [Agrococcus sp. TF02-05]|uniref:cell wall-binding repeat-containing protein n=1 Tax=Agrococcus sp. TF02-05 TaxID=2815211 RepID=UPI001AA156F1|nr:cell wall-binding repeat-containing protein [Agrococcus sp. TF02-05]MBO1770691.1 cell wall-binding repeat-containing protein [Agrococcus sp. TF02-05]
MTTVAGAAPAEAATQRIAGSDRWETSAAISRADRSGSSTVFLASGRVFSDALAAAPVAAAEGARLLLSDAEGIPQPIADEIRRLAPTEIVIVGGPATLTPAVEEQARGLAPRVTRIAGPDRVTVSMALLQRQQSKGTSPSRIWVVSGDGFADALSAASVAARHGHGLVLTQGVGTAFEGMLTERLGGVSHLTIAGGPASVAPAVQDWLGTTGRAVDRIGGVDRYDVAVKINQRFTSTTTSGRALLASGEVFTDGLSGAVLAGALGAPMYLTPARCAPSGDVAAEFRRLGVSSTLVLGGSDTISEPAAALVPCSALGETATELLRRINEERAAVGARPLATDGCLATMATGWAGAMASGGLAGSAHNPSLTAEARACALRGWGENVGRTGGAAPDAARIMSAWMASEGHRNNILRASFTHIGIGVDHGSNGSWYYVLDFGTR